MAENRDDLLHHYDEMRAKLLAAIDGLDDAAMADPSLDDWSVANHLAHIALWDDIRASEVTRISAGHDSAWRMTEQEEAAFSPLAAGLRRSLSPAQARWEIETTHTRLLQAIAEATARGLDGSLYGEAGLRSFHEREHAGWITRWRGGRGI